MNKEQPWDGKRLAVERKKAGLNQAQLGEIVGVSQKSISKYELGTRRPQYEAIVKMAEYFHVSTDYLLGIADRSESGSYPEENKEANSVKKQLLEIFDHLSPGRQQHILAEAMVQLEEQEKSVAADREFLETPSPSSGTGGGADQSAGVKPA